MIVHEFEICYGAANKIIKEDLKMIWTIFVPKRS